MQTGTYLAPLSHQFDLFTYYDQQLLQDSLPEYASQ